MLKITKGEECNPTEDVVLAWSDMKWELQGSHAKVVDIPENEICNKNRTFFFSFGLANWYNCKEGCKKFTPEASMPSIPNFERNAAVSSWFMEKMFIKEKGKNNEIFVAR